MPAKRTSRDLSNDMEYKLLHKNVTNNEIKNK